MPDDGSLDLFSEVPESESDPEAESDGVVPDAASSVPSADDPPAGREPRVWSVSQVNRAVRSLLETTVDPLWISGEIANWTRARSGHCYFTLKDDRAQIRCVMWERNARALPADPEDGMEVRVHGTLTLYEARGEYQFSVERVEADGAEGLWRLAFEKLRKKLAAEGLLEPSRKRPIPRHPRVVGVVTSATGAALRDILSVLRRRAPWTEVVVRGARVQGDGAAREVARAMEALAAYGRCDVIIVGRGGGSIEDLWAFNEEVVARAIAACPVPVVSAVGHEVDVTIADLVADLRAPTPSAGAESVAPDGEALARQLRRLPERLAGGLRGSVRRRRVRVDAALGALARAMERRFAPLRQRLDHGRGRMERGMRGTLARRRQALTGAAGRLHALSPLAVLDRGYAVPTGPDGHLLREIGDFGVGASFDLRVRNGFVAARVESTRPLPVPELTAHDHEPAPHVSIHDANPKPREGDGAR